MAITNNTSLLEKHLRLLVSVPKHFVNLLIRKKLIVIELLPGRESLINNVWRRCAILFLLVCKFPLMESKILSTLEFHQKSKRTTFIDKLSSLKTEDMNMLHIYLFQTLLLESISNEKVCQQFWTPVCKTISERLLLPTETDCLVLDSNSSTLLSKKQEEELSSLMMKKTNLQSRNCQKTFYQLSTSTVVNKWEKEVTKPEITKSLKIKLKLSNSQKIIFNEWINTSNYVYNKTIDYIKKGHSPNFYSLRDLLVTKNTKKGDLSYQDFESKLMQLKTDKKALVVSGCSTETIDKLIYDTKKQFSSQKKNICSVRNTNIKDWELNTPKDIRAGAINDVCNAHKTAFTNMKNGNITHFSFQFRKHYNTNKSIVIPKSMVNVNKNEKGTYFKIAPSFMGENSNFYIRKRTLKNHQNVTITSDSRLIKQNNEYWIIVPVVIRTLKKQKPINYCGVDPGVRTFMTTFGNAGCVEYKHNKALIDKINKQIFYLKEQRTKQCHNKRISLRKREQKKINLTNELHWKTINDIIATNDFIFYGDIKSHNITKGGKNSILNQNFNDLKFYKFKERLLFKAIIHNRKIYVINESYTSKCCSNCGCINNPGSSKTYNCLKCNSSYDRDINAAKNILIKGIVTCL